MRTVISDPLPTEVETLLQREPARPGPQRRGVGGGVPHRSHPAISTPRSPRRSRRCFAHWRLRPDWRSPTTFNLGDSKNNFRVPDGGLHRPGAADMWHPTAALVVEIPSPDDETWEKLPFYAAHHVDEALILDPDTREVHWLALTDNRYEPIERSTLIELGPRGA